MRGRPLLQEHFGLIYLLNDESNGFHRLFSFKPELAADLLVRNSFLGLLEGFPGSAQVALALCL